MQFHTLKRVHKNKQSAQVGRGGKRGKTSGRGGKGQTARAGHKIYPQIRDMIKRIPKLRGRGKSSFKSFAASAFPVNLDELEKHFENGAKVTSQTLFEKGLVAHEEGRLPRIKILGRGTLSKKLALSGLAISASAKVAVEKVGGSVMPLPVASKKVKKA